MRHVFGAVPAGAVDELGVFNRKWHRSSMAYLDRRGWDRRGLEWVVSGARNGEVVTRGGSDRPGSACRRVRHGSSAGCRNGWKRRVSVGAVRKGSERSVDWPGLKVKTGRPGAARLEMGGRVGMVGAAGLDSGSLVGHHLHVYDNIGCNDQASAGEFGLGSFQIIGDVSHHLPPAFHAQHQLVIRPERQPGQIRQG